MRTFWLSRQFMIGTDEHLRALGLLLVTFGAADEALADYVSSLLAITGDKTTDLKELQDLNFSGKVKGFRMLVSVVSDLYGVDPSKVLRQLDAVAQMADHRNDIVHGWVEWDAKRGRPVFRNKQKPLRSAEAADIKDLCKRIERWFDDIRDAFQGFLKELGRKINSAHP